MGGDNSQVHVMAEAVLVGEEREERGGHSLAYLAFGFGDLERSGLCVDH